MKKYYIVYSYSTENASGSGCCFTTRKNSIKTMEDINGIADSIKEDFGFSNVVILSWKRIRF